MEDFLVNIKIDIENVLYSLKQYSSDQLYMPKGTGPYYIDENYVVMYYDAFRYCQLNDSTGIFCGIESDSYYLVHPYILLPRSLPMIDDIARRAEMSLTRHWYSFFDSYSGGYRKTPYDIIYIRATSETEACDIFYRIYRTDPNYVACNCCGPDYFIDYLSYNEILEILPNEISYAVHH